MAASKYAKCLIQKPSAFPYELQTRKDGDSKDPVPGIKTTHLANVDDSVLKGFFAVDSMWLWSGKAKGPSGESHVHDFTHVLAFAGGNEANPHDFHGEITMWIDGHKEVITRTCLVLIPAGVVHGPISFGTINHPVLFMSIATASKHIYQFVDPPRRPTKKKKYTIIDEFTDKFPLAANGTKGPPPPPRPSNARATLLLNLDGEIAKGGFYVDFRWIWEGNGGTSAPPHTHEDWAEFLAVIGADPKHPYDIAGNTSVALGDEFYLTTKSSLICIPPKVRHCPWDFHDISGPTIVISAGPKSIYTGSHRKA